ncbi:DUF4366 domain-containing protein [Clostridia bacterium OttesenSCG-928-O13]|nr:DUF4366 domain-containing protein [Clostridia bacterium OttesenSCG-928-O13]
MRSKILFGILMALTLCVGVIFSPVTAYAATEKDTTPPKLTAELEGETLKVSATDDISGVQGIYVDGKHISTLVNGAATVSLKDYHGNGKEVSVYAMDTAGNKSEPVKFTNPLYQAPVALPPASTPAPSSSSTAPPASSSSSQAPAASSSAPSSSSSQSQSGSSSSSSQSQGAADSSSPSSSSPAAESAIPDSSDAFTPGGAGEVLDTAAEDSKDFYTITTPDGYVYYLVIDHAREGDNVYFLNAVTEADLIGLAGSATVPGQSVIPEPQPTPEPDDSSAPDAEPEPEKKEGGGFGTIIFIILIVAAVGGAGWYLKIYKPKQQAAMDGEDDFGGEEWDEESTLPDDYDYDAEEAYQSGNDAEYENEEADILEQ